MNAYTYVKTKSPELKIDGQPQSGTAEISSRSKSSSIFWTQIISASMKIIFAYSVNFQAFNFVQVTPSSARPIRFNVCTKNYI